MRVTRAHQSLDSGSESSARGAMLGPYAACNVTETMHMGSAISSDDHPHTLFVTQPVSQTDCQKWLTVLFSTFTTPLAPCIILITWSACLAATVSGCGVPSGDSLVEGISAGALLALPGESAEIPHVRLDGSSSGAKSLREVALYDLRFEAWRNGERRRNPNPVM